MRIDLFISTLLLGSLMGNAQILHVKSIEEIKLVQPIEKIEIAPSGTYVILSKYNNRGLTKVNLKDMKSTVITEANGAGYNAQALKNGDIIYREVSDTPQRSVTIKKYIAKKEISSTIIPSTQKNIQAISAIADSHVMTNQDFLLELTHNGKVTILAPFGEGKRYIWPSISPDGKKLLFFESGNGAFVTDLEGKNPVALGILRAAKWYNNDIVVGQRDKDNGEIITSSSIIAKNIHSGEEQTLTNDSVIAMYPSVTAIGDKILYSTPDGQAFLINIDNQ